MQVILQETQAQEMETNSSSLTLLANKYGSDKGTTHPDSHGYSLIYDMLFAHMRDEPLNILEFGLQIVGPKYPHVHETRITTATPSASMWLDFFRNSHVYGFDISDFTHISKERFTFIQGDMGVESDIRNVLDHCSEFDLVIDDASHASYHQQLAFVTLFPYLNDGGYYVIEDLQWQPAEVERDFPTDLKTANLFRQFNRAGAFKNTGPIPAERYEALASSINTVQIFGDECEYGFLDKMLIVHKAADSPRHSNFGQLRGNVYKRWSNVHEARGDLAQAIEAARKAVDYAPDSLTFNRRLANLLSKTGNVVEAQAIQQRIVERAPHDANILRDLGLTLSRQGKFAEAETYLRRATELMSDHPNFLVNLAQALVNQRKFEDALEAFRRVIELAPENATAYHGAASVLIERQRALEAISMAEKAVEIDPDCASFKRTLKKAQSMALR